jgi:hypothetical protein
MDPLSAPLACPCVDGHAQRDYGRLASFLQGRIGRSIELSYAEAIPNGREFDLIIGKVSVVRHDAGQSGLAIRSLALLTGRNGKATLEGRFVVRGEDPARSIEDLGTHRLLLGPPEADEKHGAALAILEAFDLPAPKNPGTSPACNTAALAVVENEADATVISDYAMPLLEGCGTLEQGELRVIGRTDPVPFIGVFATAHLPRSADPDVLAGLKAVAGDPELLQAMESKHGFLSLPPLDASAAWADWRGAGRQGRVPRLPEKLPSRKLLLWSRTLTGPGMAGLALANRRLIVPDKSLGDTHDIWRCLDADTGRELWKLSYRAAGDMDFTNSPRANPVIVDDHVYLLGAFGHLHCVELETGTVVWRRDFRKDFGCDLPTWGWCSTPLPVDDLLMVNPGSGKASLAALDRKTGQTRWQTPGDPVGHAAFILATLGGRRQVVGYDAVSAGGWDPATGRRLWKLVPEHDADFNVATPIVVDDKLLLSTENNGTRLHAFDRQGCIIPTPVAVNEDLDPDTSTPVTCAGLVLGSSRNLHCLDLARGLATCWQTEDVPFDDYATLIAGPKRVLVIPLNGHLQLLRADRGRLHVLDDLDLFDDVPDTERDVWSHPVTVGKRLYIRNMLGVYCFLLSE